MVTSGFQTFPHSRWFWVTPFPSAAPACELPGSPDSTLGNRKSWCDPLPSIGTSLYQAWTTHTCHVAEHPEAHLLLSLLWLLGFGGKPRSGAYGRRIYFKCGSMILCKLFKNYQLQLLCIRKGCNLYLLGLHDMRLKCEKSNH